MNIDWKKKYFFVDESGDPNFYSTRGKYIVWTEGCSSYLQFALVVIKDPSRVRKAIKYLAKEISKDPLLAWIPSLEKRKDNFVFHACIDVPEIRDSFIRLLATLDFSTIIVHVSKDQALFHSKYFAKSEIFYHDIVTTLFEHSYHILWDDNIIYFEKRGRKNNQKVLSTSIDDALSKHGVEKKHNVLVQTPSDEPCLQIADYMNRIVQRAIVMGETRFQNFLSSKINAIIYRFKETKKSPQGSSVE